MAGLWQAAPPPTPVSRQHAPGPKTASCGIQPAHIRLITRRHTPTRQATIPTRRRTDAAPPTQGAGGVTTPNLTNTHPISAHSLETAPGKVDPCRVVSHVQRLGGGPRERGRQPPEAWPAPMGSTGQSRQSASRTRPDATDKPLRLSGAATIPIQRSPGPNMAVPAAVFPDERTPTAGGLVSTSSTSDSGAVGWSGFGAVQLVSTSSTSVSGRPPSSLVELVETNGTFVEANPKMTHFHRRTNARDSEHGD